MFLAWVIDNVNKNKNSVAAVRHTGHVFAFFCSALYFWRSICDFVCQNLGWKSRLQLSLRAPAARDEWLWSSPGLCLGGAAQEECGEGLCSACREPQSVTKFSLKWAPLLHMLLSLSLPNCKASSPMDLRCSWVLKSPVVPQTWSSPLPLHWPYHTVQTSALSTGISI